MEIQFGDNFVVRKKLEEVYDFLVDPKRFGPLLPEYESMEIQDDGTFLVKLKVGISHIRGTATVRMSLVQAERPKHAVYEGKGDVPSGSATVRAGFDLEETPGNETKVIWSGQANVVGRVISLAGGMLKPLAKKNIKKLIDSLQKALG